MKKIWLITLWLTVIVSGCSFTGTTTEEVTDIDAWDSIMEVVNTKTKSSYSWAMQKPSIDEMENFDAITKGYVKEWNNDYTVKEDNLKYIDKWCSKIEIYWWWKHTKYSNTFKKSEVKAGNTVTLKWKYNFDDSKLELTKNEMKVLSDKWWNIVPADRYENYWKLNYSEDSAENDWYIDQEEWIDLYYKIWWDSTEYERYPANTVLITNDLLLHSFHKLFDNTLKYYEQTVARDTIAELSNNLFTRFIGLAKEEKDPELKNTYEFLATYWWVPASILIDTSNFWGSNSDDEIKNSILNNVKTYQKELDKIDSKYSNTISSTVERILGGNGFDLDSFLAEYVPQYVNKHEIMQDYTQFVPRSHYTDNVDLKTYFMAMKWLMREKFYFGDDKLTDAALLMVNNISDKDTEKLASLSAKIKKLIWWDDDLTLETLSDWMKENKINTSETIKKLSKKKRLELSKLVPQKIQSNWYVIEPGTEISDEEAKDSMNGFVFFWEKFTLDSYMFDLMTAAKTETEFKYKPKKQTALIVPDILEDDSDAAEIVDLWMKESIKKENVLEDKKHKQYSSYNKVKKEAKEKIDEEIKTSSVMETVYHKRLKMLGNLINEPEKNAPYFKVDWLYGLKNLLTYMGSYTELKHDTLLYVKQAYAMWLNSAAFWEFEKNCKFKVDPPSLPTPKWFIEADVDIIDNLIELNNEVQLDFEELWENIEWKFTWFNEFLIHTKNILELQQNNQTIEDEDFEWMRTAYDKLWFIVYPFGKKVSQKEMRSSIIADIFTSENNEKVDPLYEAVGRPAIMLVMIDDINWKRIAIWPVFTHYEFYDSDNIIDAKGSRLNDLQWQANYDSLSWDKLNASLSTLSRKLYEWLK